MRSLLRILFKPLPFIGGAILFLYIGQKLQIEGNKCEPSKRNKVENLLCISQEINKNIYSEIDLFVNNLYFWYKNDFVQLSRDESFESAERFKNLNKGFNFSFNAQENELKGFLLLSRIEPDLKTPKVELWDLKQQKLLHIWPINSKELTKKLKLKNQDIKVLRFLHPLLLNDGSIITHIQPENENTQLLKFDYCGNLLKYIADGSGYHHSIEKINVNGIENIFVPTAKVSQTSEFYANYKNFSDNYRNEGIAILDSDLEIKEIIPLDKIFYSAGLLEYVNNKEGNLRNDVYHLNDVHPYFNDEGELNLLLSMRNFGLLSYNHYLKKVNWATSGLTSRQHDITPFLSEKNIFTVFDNGNELNQPDNDFKGNSIVMIDFSKVNNKKGASYLLGRNPSLEGLFIKRFDFLKLPKNLVPKTISEGRGRFIDESKIYIEETNHGRAFVYDFKKDKFDWNYINKGKKGYSSFLGWSRFLDTIPSSLPEKNTCSSIKSN